LTVKILIDSREQLPYRFESYDCETISEALVVGDYSLAGLESRVSIERKSLDDLAGTLTAGRERFARECERGRTLEFFGLVIEASLDDIRRHRYQSQALPQCLLQTLAAWSIRYGLHVFFCGNRPGAEYMTFSLLQKFLREETTRWEAVSKAQEAALSAS
jgi:ERCC4-type nuclease